MNKFIRVPRKILRCDYDTRLYGNSVIHYKSHAALKYSTIGSPYFLKCLGITRHYAILGPCTSQIESERRHKTYRPSYCHSRKNAFHTSAAFYDVPSSKVEATVKRMKDKQKEKVEKILKDAANSTATTLEDEEVAKTGTVKATESEKAPVAKKSLKTRIWEECVHYYHGFRLLFIDMNVCGKLLWRVLNGHTLTRRENKLLVRTTSDLFRLIPFSVFIIVPFMEFLLPFFIKFFPGMLPSTFQTAKEREDKLKHSLQVKLEMAKFLQQTLDQMTPQHRKDHKSEDAKEFDQFFQKIKDPKEYVSSEDIIKFAKHFEDEITLDSLTREQLAALCRLLELSTIGTTNFLRFQLRVKLRSLAADDRVIAREGVNGLDLFELQQACKARGMRAYGLTADRLRSQLQEWIDLSLNEKVPQTLLLLSRALLISDDTMTADKLKETMRALPDAVAAQTKTAISECEGKVDHKSKIEVIKNEELKIKEEREEEREERAKAEILLDNAPTIETEKVASEPIQTFSPQLDVCADPSEKISSKDVELLSTALRFSSDKKLVVAKETIKDIKEELQDYKEDVEELKEVRDVVKEPVHESRAAKLLFKRVNKMMGQLDKVVGDLEKVQQHMQETACKSDSPQVCETEMVNIEELLNTIRKFKETSDESRLKQIERVLSKLDTDKDGVVTVDELLKVVEAIGRENVKLNENQLEELINLLEKEELIEAEQKIEKAIAKSIKEAQKIEEAKNKILEAARACEAELRDIAPSIEDKATDLNVVDPAKVITSEGPKSPAKETVLLDAAEKHAEEILRKSEIPSGIPSQIPPPSQVKTKDKML